MAPRKNTERQEESLENDDMIAASPTCNGKVEDMESERSVHLNIRSSRGEIAPKRSPADGLECQTGPERPHLQD